MVRGINGCLQGCLRNGVYRENNARVKSALALKRQRARNGTYFLLEGFREIHRALISGYRCSHVFCGELIADKEIALDRELTSLGIEKLYCSKDILENCRLKRIPRILLLFLKRKSCLAKSF